MSLSKKHFIKIAEILNQNLPVVQAGSTMETEFQEETIKNIAKALSDYFATENPLFDRQRFKEAVFKEVLK